MVEEELELQEDLAAQVEDEGPWGHSYGLALQERALNALLFVPVGIAAFFAFSSWSARIFFGPVLSLTVETTQWALAADRMADTGDLLVNSAGSWVGTLLALVAVAMTSRWGRREPVSPSVSDDHRPRHPDRS
ncbi:VanZ family protein [Nocardiopsis nanhaiensis]